MNFEKFYKSVCINWKNLPNKKQTMFYLFYHYDLLLWKKKKLKLGAIVFIIRQYKFDEVLLWEEAEIKFINQDTTLDDERSFETIYKKFSWEWNTRSYIALSVVIFIALRKIKKFFKGLFYFYLPTLVYRDNLNDYIIKLGFQQVYNYNSISGFADLSRISYWLIDVLTDFSIHYNIIF